PWPGNVRELEHCISRAALKALSRGASRQDIITLTPQLLELCPAADFSGNSTEAAAAATMLPTGDLKTAVAQLQRQMISAALQANAANWSQAARQLALDPSNLHKLAGKLGLKPGSVTAERRDAPKES
ncbi:MAG: hypothetical protein E6Q75_14780, partial [Rheinheimera sp.]